MDHLNENLRDLFYYNELTNTYIRSDDIKITSNYHEEFNRIFNIQYGNFNSDDFIIDAVKLRDENNEMYENENECRNEGELCTCTHPIKNLYFIKHIPSNQIWQVGSHCVEKIFPKLKKNMKLLKQRELYKIRGRVCHYCEEPLMDLRKKEQKSGYCNMNCFHKNHYVMKFGKYKGQILMEVLYTKEGFSYYQWVKDTIAQDEFAFNSYPLFLEIINETFIEEIEDIC